MTMRPLVHIGMAKAASTFLQLEVFPNAEGLRNLGKHHVPDELRAAGMALTRRTSADWNLATFSQPFHAAQAAAEGCGLRPVLSNEDLSVYKFLDPEMMARRLRDILGAFDVLLLIREPTSWVRSHYLFRLEHQNPVAALGFDHWLRTHLESRRIGSDVLEISYCALARTYEMICGGTIHILPYELMRSDKGRFALELSEILGTPEDHLRALLDAPPKASAHKMSITKIQQEFYELFRWVVLEQPARAEAEIRAILSRPGTLPLTAALDETLRDVAAAPLIDRKAWAGVFRAAAGLCHGEDAAAVPDIPDDMAKRLKDVARMQIRQLKVNHNFDLASYGLTYST